MTLNKQKSPFIIKSSFVWISLLQSYVQILLPHSGFPSCKAAPSRSLLQPLLFSVFLNGNAHHPLHRQWHQQVTYTYTDPTFVITKWEQRTEMLLKRKLPDLKQARVFILFYFILFYFSSFSGHRLAQREWVRRGLINAMQGSINPTTRKGWPHHRGLRPLFFPNSGVGSFMSHKHSTDRWKRCEMGPTLFRPYLKEGEKWQEGERLLLAPDGFPITHALVFL